MRLDSVKESEKISLEAPSMRALSYMLRHQETWPAGFEWNYRNCHSCAMGLAYKTWKSIQCPDSFEMSRALGMDVEVARGIFCAGPHYAFSFAPFDFVNITPEMVADKIDEYAAVA